jgi:hypothetical protein
MKINAFVECEIHNRNFKPEICPYCKVLVKFFREE